LNLLLSSGEEKETHTLLDPLERAGVSLSSREEYNTFTFRESVQILQHRMMEDEATAPGIPRAMHHRRTLQSLLIILIPKIIPRHLSSIIFLLSSQIMFCDWSIS
jgi:hypothetical protein